MNAIHCFRVKEARKGLELSVRANATHAIQNGSPEINKY